MRNIDYKMNNFKEINKNKNINIYFYFIILIGIYSLFDYFEIDSKSFFGKCWLINIFFGSLIILLINAIYFIWKYIYYHGNKFIRN